MKNFFRRIFGGKATGEFVFTTRHLARRTSNGEMITRNTGMQDHVYYIDSLTSGSISGSIVSNSAIQVSGSNTTSRENKQDTRKAVQPIEVFNEIKTETPEISFENLDEKISVVKERLAVLSEHLDAAHLKDEHQTLFYLQNRKNYLKTIKKSPFDWAMTNHDAVDDLCKRYKLRVVPLQQYYTLVPQEGIKEMERFTKAYKAVTGDDTPIFELVVKEPDTKEAQKEQRKKDRDPILLANSPLSNAMFVLGAWDDEVAIVDEIIYGAK